MGPDVRSDATSMGMKQKHGMGNGNGRIYRQGGLGESKTDLITLSVAISQVFRAAAIAKVN